jgi:hypothetical protein
VADPGVRATPQLRTVCTRRREKGVI